MAIRMKAPSAEANKSSAEMLKTLISRLRNFTSLGPESHRCSCHGHHQFEAADTDDVTCTEGVAVEGLQRPAIHDRSIGRVQVLDFELPIGPVDPEVTPGNLVVRKHRVHQSRATADGEAVSLFGETPADKAHFQRLAIGVEAAEGDTALRAPRPAGGVHAGQFAAVFCNAANDAFARFAQGECQRDEYSERGERRSDPESPREFVESIGQAAPGVLDCRSRSLDS